MAFHDSMGADGWRALSEHCQQQAHYNPGSHVCEGRELIVGLPNVLRHLDPQELLDVLIEEMEEEYGVPCAGAIHDNEGNLHLHVVESERELLQEAEVSIATRNTYFDADGKRSTKSKCTGDDGELLPGCRFVKKGEALSRKTFGPKKNEMASPAWMANEKQRWCDVLNDIVDRQIRQTENVHGEYHDELRRTPVLVVYAEDRSIEMPMTRLDRGEPEEVRAEKILLNAQKKEYNRAAQEAVELGIMTPEEAIEHKIEVLERMAPAHVEDPSTAQVAAALEDMRFELDDAAAELQQRNNETVRVHGGLDDVIQNAADRRQGGLSSSLQREMDIYRAVSDRCTAAKKELLARRAEFSDEARAARRAYNSAVRFLERTHGLIGIIIGIVRFLIASAQLKQALDRLYEVKREMAEAKINCASFGRFRKAYREDLKAGRQPLASTAAKLEQTLRWIELEANMQRRDRQELEEPDR